jgi:hypothetical protein
MSRSLATDFIVFAGIALLLAACLVFGLLFSVLPSLLSWLLG